MKTTHANGVDFAFLEWGDPSGPLALCLHGFPDSAIAAYGCGALTPERWRRVVTIAVAPRGRGSAPAGSRVHRFEVAGHFVHLERAGEVHGMVTDFLMP